MVAMGKSKVLGKRKYFEEKQEDNTELIPGLPDDVTVQVICTKLSWRTFHVLSSVSSVWLGAIRSGEIHDVRVRSRAAETLALMKCFTGRVEEGPIMALYSLRDKALCLLPTLPCFVVISAYAAIGGKVYILKGSELWVFDVAGQKKWQKCASMLTGRMGHRCSAFQGKIYVFGGADSLRQPIGFSELYDPKVDAWTKISEMKSVRRAFDTCVVRDEILVHGGRVYDVYQTQYNQGTVEKHWRPAEGSTDGIEAYNPAEDSWRTILPGDFGNHELKLPGDHGPEVLFTAHERLLCLSHRKIESINLEEKSVEGLHTFKLRSKLWRPCWRPDAVLATNDGFFIKGHFAAYHSPLNRCRLFQSTEPVIGKKRILLEEVERSPSVTFTITAHLAHIQL